MVWLETGATLVDDNYVINTNPAYVLSVVPEGFAELFFKKQVPKFDLTEDTRLLLKVAAAQPVPPLSRL